MKRNKRITVHIADIEHSLYDDVPVSTLQQVYEQYTAKQQKLDQERKIQSIKNNMTQNND